MPAYTLINARKTAPSVSILWPTHRASLQHKLDTGGLKDIIKKAEHQLLDYYPEKPAKKVAEKLYKVAEEIDFTQPSESIALYVSPDTDAVIYLPFAVKEKLVIDNSFEVRDLLYLAKYSYQYQALAISQNHIRLYYGFNNILSETPTDKFHSFKEVEIDHHSRVGNFSDTASANEITFEKYLRDIDHVLTEELKIIDAPVIIMSVDKTIGLFKKITHNKKKILGYAEGNFDYASKQDIYKAIQPLLEQKRENDGQEALRKLDEAMSQKRCVSGIANVWAAAREKKGRLLVVEKDYYCTAKVEGNRLTVFEESDEQLPTGIQDAVDDAIELVLRSDGEVVFVKDGALADHKRIALVTYY